jgi:hypothetical protein
VFAAKELDTLDTKACTGTRAEWLERLDPACNNARFLEF